MRGRHPAAPELRLLRGDRPSRRNDAAPIAREGTPRPPRSMSPAQRRVFRQVVTELEAMRVHCAPDVLIIEALAGLVDWHRRARDELQRTGAWGAGARGGDVATPAWRIYRDSAREIAKLSSELGLTPTARSRIVATPTPSDPAGIEALLS